MRKRNRLFLLTGLGIALLIAVLLSPFASSDPDGLERVSQDLQFDHQAIEEAPAQKLPFYRVFEEYALRGVPERIATPLAGLVGTLATFGLALRALAAFDLEVLARRLLLRCRLLVLRLLRTDAADGLASAILTNQRVVAVTTTLINVNRPSIKTAQELVMK